MKMQQPRTFWECKTSRVCDEFFPRIANVTIPRGRLQEAAAAAAEDGDVNPLAGTAVRITGPERNPTRLRPLRLTRPDQPPATGYGLALEAGASPRAPWMRRMVG